MLQQNNVEKPEKTYIDLGLPSGILWATENEKDRYNQKQAIKKYGKSLPRRKDFDELEQFGTWQWLEDQKGYRITGPNGNSIFLKADGEYRDRETINVGRLGKYMSRTKSFPFGKKAKCLFMTRLFTITDSEVHPKKRYISVRLIKKSK